VCNSDEVKFPERERSKPGLDEMRYAEKRKGWEGSNKKVCESEGKKGCEGCAQMMEFGKEILDKNVLAGKRIRTHPQCKRG
jgi:hypothetical protein